MSTNATIVHRDVCPLCASRNLHVAHTCRDELVSHETFQMLRCAQCQFLFTQDVPSFETMHAYYKHAQYIPHETNYRGVWMNLLHGARKRLRLPGKIRMLQGSRNILDIGCGDGVFPLAVQRAGMRVIAIESNTAMREYCRSLDIDCRDVSALPELPEHSFDAITLWHVLEHVHDLHGTMEHISRLLAPKGVAIVAVPNIGGPLMRYYGTYDVPRHIWHFQPGTLRRLAAMHSLKVVTTQALHADAFYMGLYYERMKGGYPVRGIALAMLDMFYGLLCSHPASLVYILAPESADNRR